MKVRNRSFRQNDWFGAIAQGDVQYEDGFDDWNDMVNAISGADNVPVYRNHKDMHSIGTIGDFQLDQVNKLVKAHTNAPIREGDAISVQWAINDEDRIVGLNHVAAGDFKPACPKKICNLDKKNRGLYDPEEVEMTEDIKQESVITENDNTGDEPDYKKLYEDSVKEFNKYKENLKQTPTPKEEPELELKEKEDIKQEIKTEVPKIGIFSDWKDHRSITLNTKRVFNDKIYR